MADRIIGIRHEMKASHYGPAKPVQVYMRTEGSPNVTFTLTDEATTTEFIRRVIWQDDRIVLSGSRSAHALAYEVAYRGFEVGAETYRIPRAELEGHMLITTDDMSKVLTNVFTFMPKLFTRVTRAEVYAWRAKRQLDQSGFGF